MLRGVLLLTAFLACDCSGASAGDALTPQTADPIPAAAAAPIQDNSLLMEEAYNQEAGVVQHINLFSYSWTAKDWAYRFTQEWPVPGRARHQWSFDVPVLNSSESSRPGAGFGDVALNYRYQVLGGADARLAFAPRLSLLLPSGDSRQQRGSGGVGLQGNLPASLVLSDRWVTHLNAGATVVPRSRNEAGERAFVSGYNLGHSLIWLAHSRFNVLLETLWAASGSVVGPGETAFSNELLLTPAIRWAHNFESGLQIVPGLGISIGAGPSAGERGVVVYLSFEHPLPK